MRRLGRAATAAGRGGRGGPALRPDAPPAQRHLGAAGMRRDDAQHVVSPSVRRGRDGGIRVPPAARLAAFPLVSDVEAAARASAVQHEHDRRSGCARRCGGNVTPARSGSPLFSWPISLEGLQGCALTSVHFGSGMALIQTQILR
eukprot:806979-Prymnesium_polylepis.2